MYQRNREALNMTTSFFLLLFTTITFANADMLDSRSLISSIQTLDDETFDPLTSNTPSLILFYAPWCGHSQNLLPAYESVAATFQSLKDDTTSPPTSTPSPVLIARVDVDKYRNFAKRFDLRGFPTIKYFKSTAIIKEKGSTYTGGLDAASIINYVNQQAGTSRKLQQTSTWVRSLIPKTFEAVSLDPTRHVLVQFHAPWCTQCDAFAETWETVAKTFRSDDERIVLASVDADKYRDLAQQQDVTSYPTVKYYPGYTVNNGVEIDIDGESEGEGDISVETTSDGSVTLPESVDGAFSRTYNGGTSSQELVSFINQVAGLERVVGGDIHREAGRSKKLDQVAGLFVAAMRSKRLEDAELVIKDVHKEKNRLCGKDEKENKSMKNDDKKETKMNNDNGGDRSETLHCAGARLYGRVMDKVLAHVNGIEWTSKELIRLDTLIKDEDVNHLQRTDMMLRRNVLDAFQ